MPRTASKAVSSAEELQAWNEQNAQLILKQHGPFMAFYFYCSHVNQYKL